MDSDDGSASEAEEDDEWLFAEDRKRKGKGKEPAKASRKKKKSVIEEDPKIGFPLPRLQSCAIFSRVSVPTIQQRRLLSFLRYLLDTSLLI